MKIKLLLIAMLCMYFSDMHAQTKKENTFEVYGFAMMDAGYNFKTINPDWYDALRVTKLPSDSKEFLPDGKVFYSVRQSRFGVKSFTPTSIGDVSTKFEFDLFGVGDYAGQTTIRLRHAYGEIGKFLAGQTNSVFMDGDVFPNSLEYWGPTGMVFFRNIQIRYTPVMDKENKLAFALEAPGASADPGKLKDRTELESVKQVFNVPDFTGHYRYTGSFGYIQLGGIVGSIKWRDVSDTASFQLNGSAVRWGGTLSSNINIGKKAVLRLQGVVGEGMENYMNDAPIDIGVQYNPGDSTQPVKGKALPVWGATAFVDINWSKYFSSSFGYSVETIDIDKLTVNDVNLMSPETYKQGQYGLVNLLYYPVNNVMAGVEFNFGRRDNYNGFHSTISEVRFAFKYNFSKIFTWN